MTNELMERVLFDSITDRERIYMNKVNDDINEQEQCLAYFLPLEHKSEHCSK